jgi:hypothetical protein
MLLAAVGRAHVPAYLASLSIWSPKPGVSTTVSEMRVPSSSSSRERQSAHMFLPPSSKRASCQRTDGDGLDLDALLDMGCVGIIRILVLEDLLPAQRVHEGGPACVAWSE